MCNRLLTREECNKRIAQISLLKNQPNDIKQLDRILKKLFRREKNNE